MAKMTPTWCAETDGSLHKTERAATEHDLRKLAEHLESARPALDLWEALARNADKAVTLLQAYSKAHPGTGGGRAPSKPPEGTRRKGPARKKKKGEPK